MNDMVSFSTVSDYMRKNKKKLTGTKIEGKKTQNCDNRNWIIHSSKYVFLKAEVI